MITLFYYPTCPYCKKVIDYFNAIKLKDGIDYCLKNARDPQTREGLEKIGGKVQVPFLTNEDQSIKIYESAEIIKYCQKIKNEDCLLR